MRNDCLAYRVDVIYIVNVDAEHCALGQEKGDSADNRTTIGTRESETID